MCSNVNELCQTVVTEHSLEVIHLGISAVIVMKVKIAKQYKITVGICKLCEKLSRNSVAGAIKLNSLQRLNGQAFERCTLRESILKNESNTYASQT